MPLVEYFVFGVWRDFVVAVPLETRFYGAFWDQIVGVVFCSSRVDQEAGAFWLGVGVANTPLPPSLCSTDTLGVDNGGHNCSRGNVEGLS